jgi:hypothetical protein
MHYYMYEIRNLLDGKIYVGVHKTKNLNDGYMGSGALLKKAIEEYGIENFKKTILEWFSSSEEMFQREKEVVNQDFLLREDVYNLIQGGKGGFEWINSSDLPKMKGKRHSEETKKLLREKMQGRKNPDAWIIDRNLLEEEAFKKMCSKGGKAQKGKLKSSEHKAKISAAMKARYEQDPTLRESKRKTFLKIRNSTTSEETKKKISEALKKAHAKKKAQKENE